MQSVPLLQNVKRPASPKNLFSRRKNLALKTKVGPTKSCLRVRQLTKNCLQPSCSSPNSPYYKPTACSSNPTSPYSRRRKFSIPNSSSTPELKSYSNRSKDSPLSSSSFADRLNSPRRRALRRNEKFFFPTKDDASSSLLLLDSTSLDVDDSSQSGNDISKTSDTTCVSPSCVTFHQSEENGTKKPVCRSCSEWEPINSRKKSHLKLKVEESITPNLHRKVFRTVTTSIARRRPVHKKVTARRSREQIISALKALEKEATETPFIEDIKKVVTITLHHDDSRKAINSEVEIQCDNGEKRVLRSTCDWAESAVNGDHLWAQTSATGDFCYVGDDFCCKGGPRMKCSSCKIICHTGCIASLVEKVKFLCKPSFRDVGPRQYREHTETYHHWVHRRNQKGKCKTCCKGFQSKLLFGSKEIVAISCSWCKSAFHNKETCFDIAKFDEPCNLGIHQSIIVPPSWIVKLPRRGSFKSSLRKSPKKKNSTGRRLKEKSEKDTKPFAIKPIPSTNIRPVIVFINPKSGGNQGAKLLQKFQWLLNPRQVFDLTQGGPKAGLEMFRKVSNLRVLACGGDGTVGWILSILDAINIVPPPSVGVLPLGTGNDLARALGWGGGYTDEPISKILCNIADGEVIHLDRWKVEVEKNPHYGPTEEGKDNLPLNVLNNYFSFGVDAHIALEFHEAREANPQKFNSRLRNKMFYGQAGGKDLLQRKWKDLCDLCELQCDGKDMTAVLKEHKVHAVVFLNIPSYCSGTHPWNRSSGVEQQTDDGLIEVVGLTTYQMPLLQAGGHGTSITQCRTARLVTKKTIPMQVDGEACRLNPSIITISHLNKAAMITKTKAKVNVPSHLEQLRLEVSRITMVDYEQFHYDKEKLRCASTPLGIIMIDQDADLDQVRKHINRMMDDQSRSVTIGTPSTRPLSENWCFLDSCTAERFFRIDHAQEHLHYVTDICTEALFVLDPEISHTTLLHQAPSCRTLRSEMSVDNDLDPLDRISPGPQESTLEPTDEEVPPQEQPAEGAAEEVNKSLQDSVFSHEYFLPSILEKTSDQLIKAAKQGDLKTLKELHSRGYSLMGIDECGQTVLHHSSRHGHRDIVRYLIASAPPEIMDMRDTEKGQTALHLAAIHRRRTVCSMLVAAGATISLEDNAGQTAKSLAIKSEDHRLAQYLESQENFSITSGQTNMVYVD